MKNHSRILFIKTSIGIFMGLNDDTSVEMARPVMLEYVPIPAQSAVGQRGVMTIVNMVPWPAEKIRFLHFDEGLQAISFFDSELDKDNELVKLYFEKTRGLWEKGKVIQ